MSQRKPKPTTTDDYPVCLRAGDVAAILGVSRARAYELANSAGFPRIMIGKRIVIPKASFIAWMEAQTVTSTDAG